MMVSLNDFSVISDQWVTKDIHVHHADSQDSDPSLLVTHSLIVCFLMLWLSRSVLVSIMIMSLLYS